MQVYQAYGNNKFSEIHVTHDADNFLDKGTYRIHYVISYASTIVSIPQFLTTRKGYWKPYLQSYFFCGNTYVVVYTFPKSHVTHLRIK